MYCMRSHFPLQLRDNMTAVLNCQGKKKEKEKENRPTGSQEETDKPRNSSVHSASTLALVMLRWGIVPGLY